MTNTTKQMAEEAIRFFLQYFETEILDNNDNLSGQKIRFSLGHPILLGDVLAKLDTSNEDNWHELVMDICCRWEDLGLSKSLQEILEETIGECHGHYTDTGVQVCRDSLCNDASLKGPAAELFGFLHNIFITNNYND